MMDSAASSSEESEEVRGGVDTHYSIDDICSLQADASEKYRMVMDLRRISNEKAECTYNCHENGKGRFLDC
jgi:hypothetical protein